MQFSQNMIFGICRRVQWLTLIPFVHLRISDTRNHHHRPPFDKLPRNQSSALYIPFSIPIHITITTVSIGVRMQHIVPLVIELWRLSLQDESSCFTDTNCQRLLICSHAVMGRLTLVIFGAEMMPVMVRVMMRQGTRMMVMVMVMKMKMSLRFAVR